MPKTTTVPITGTREFIRAFKAYASKHNKSMADLVREALEIQYGDGIRDAALFFESCGYEIIHSDTEDNNTGAA